MIVRAAAVAGGTEFLTAWLKGAEPETPQEHMHGSNSAAPPEKDRWTSYNPKFFSRDEFAILDSFTAILIPTDETPGAREAHVAAFIDFVVNAAAEYAPEMQAEWRNAISLLHARQFGQLSPEQQISLVQQMSGSKTSDGYHAYRLIKEMIVYAFYTSRVGLVDVLEYKGYAYLTAFPGCTHPEHNRV